VRRRSCAPLCRIGPAWRGSADEGSLSRRDDSTMPRSGSTRRRQFVSCAWPRARCTSTNSSKNQPRSIEASSTCGLHEDVLLQIDENLRRQNLSIETGCRLKHRAASGQRRGTHLRGSQLGRCRAACGAAAASAGSRVAAETSLRLLEPGFPLYSDYAVTAREDRRRTTCGSRLAPRPAAAGPVRLIEHRPSDLLHVTLSCESPRPWRA
jgi:hypothetical protein